jgi:putative endonuclease
MKDYYIYILTNKKHGTFYIGITNNLMRRIYEHKNGIIKGFTKKYNLDKLVYFEQTTDINAAIRREKRLKKWNRAWKIELIESINSEWKDLSESFA